MSQKLRQLAKRTLYALKRDYGSLVDFYHVLGETTDWATGVSTPNVTKYSVIRAVCLPENVLNQGLISEQIRYLFRRGGFDQFGRRQVLVDRRDFPVEMEVENWYAIIAGTRYQLKAIADYGDKTGYIVSMTEDGGRRDEQVDIKLRQRLPLSQEALDEL